MLKFKLVEHPEDISELCDLAKVIWRDHYTPIIGKEQVEYMLDKFQTPHVVKNQINQQGYSYYNLYLNDQLVGYLSVKPREYSLFISKFYIEKSHRGKGLGKAMLSHTTQLMQEKNLGKLELTVNKYNHNSIAFYESQGFEIIKSEVFDIGSGYVMDDYVYQKFYKDSK